MNCWTRTEIRPECVSVGNGGKVSIVSVDKDFKAVKWISLSTLSQSKSMAHCWSSSSLAGVHSFSKLLPLVIFLCCILLYHLLIRWHTNSNRGILGWFITVGIFQPQKLKSIPGIQHVNKTKTKLCNNGQLCMTFSTHDLPLLHVKGLIHISQ